MIVSRRSSLDVWLDPRLHIRPVSARNEFDDMQALLSAPFLPPVLTLSLECTRNGYILFGPGEDGIVFDDAGRPLAAALDFRDGRKALPEPSAVIGNATPLDCAGFTGIDPAWHNYYHWLCLALPRMLSAGAARATDIKFLLPDIRQPLRLSSLGVLGIDRQVIFLQPGLYKVPELWRLSIDHPQPALLTCMDDYGHLYRAAGERLQAGVRTPERIFVARAHNPRIDSSHLKVLGPLLESLNFVQVDLEKLDFLEQAAVFRNAGAIVAAHGAGLSNLVFGRPGLRILELNDHIDGEAYLRPWFYYLSRSFGLDYSYVNLSRQPSDPVAWSDVFARFLG